MQFGDLFVQMLGQDIDVVAVLLALGPKLDLRQRLVGEAGRHHEAGMAGGVAQVNEAALRQDDDLLTIGEFDFIDLRLDLGPLHVGEARNLDLAVEMADVGHDRHILHSAHMVDGQDGFVARRGDEDVGAGRGFFHRHDFIAFHRRLQRADRIDFGHQNARAAIAERSGRALADIAETSDAGDLAGQHDVGAATDRVDQRLFAAIEIVELRLGDAVVHVDRGEGQLALLGQLIEAMDAGGGLFRHALDAGDSLGQPARTLGQDALEHRAEDFFFLVRRREQFFTGFDTCAPQREHGGVAAIVQDHVADAGLMIVPVEDALDIVPIFLQRFALDGEDGHARRGDRGGGMVLRRIDVAGRPAHFRAQRGQRFDQHGGLDRHVQRSGDTRALKRLRRAKFLAQRHQARHFGFGNIHFLAAKGSEADIGNHIILRLGGGYGGHEHISVSQIKAGTADVSRAATMGRALPSGGPYGNAI